MIVYCDGKFITDQQCLVSPFGPGFQYGQGVFETIRVYQGQPEYLDLHLKRMISGAKKTGMSVPEVPFDAIIAKLISENPINDIYRLKIILYKRENTSNGLIIFLKPYTPPLAELYKKGVSLGKGDHPVRGNLADVKSLFWYQFKAASASDFFETLLFSESGIALEGTRSNFFILKNNTFVFAARKPLRLNGAMEQIVKKRLQNAGINCMEQSLYHNDIIEADAVFICNSLIGILPVCKFENQEITTHISQIYLNEIRKFQDIYEDKKSY